MSEIPYCPFCFGRLKKVYYRGFQVVNPKKGRKYQNRNYISIDKYLYCEMCGLVESNESLTIYDASLESKKGGQ